MAQKSKSSKSKDNSVAEDELDGSSEPQDTDLTEAESADGPVSSEKTDPEVFEESIAATYESDTIVEAEVLEDVVEEEGDAAQVDDIEDLPDAAQNTTVSSERTASGPPVLAFVVGGLIAGALGYFGASLTPPPETPELDTTELTSGIETNASALSAVASDVEALKSIQVPTTDQIEDSLADLEASFEASSNEISARQTELSDAISLIQDGLAGFDSRILALETALPTAGELQTDDELAALRQRIANMTAAATAELATAREEAASVAKAAEEARLAAEAEAAELRDAAAAREAELAATANRRAAIVDLKAAVESGAPFVEVLDGFETVPEALTVSSESGVSTMAVLQGSFAEAARGALSQSSSVSEDASTAERLTAFLRQRTNARSLTEQEGDGVDAILSRAEARLGEGDLSAALREIDALPQEGKVALASWLDQAMARLDALAAIDQMSATN